MPITKTIEVFDKTKLNGLSDGDVLFLDEAIKSVGMDYIVGDAGIERKVFRSTGDKGEVVMDYVFNYRLSSNPEEEIALVGRGIGEGEAELVLELCLAQATSQALLSRLRGRKSLAPVYNWIDLYSK